MYKLLLTIRYFRSRFLAIASLLAITFGVAMLVIVLSIMGGYLVQLRENIRGQESHLQVISRDRKISVTDVAALEDLIRSVENVQATAPFVERLATYNNGLSFQPCQLKAVTPRKEMHVTRFAHFLLRPGELSEILRMPQRDPTVATRAVDALITAPERRDLSLEEVEGLFSKEWRRQIIEETEPQLIELYGEDIPPAALVGIQLLLEGELLLGDIILVVTVSPAADVTPIHRDFVVTGALKSGDFDIDSGTIYVELGEAKDFLELCDQSTGICRHQGVRVSIDDPELLEKTSKDVADRLLGTFPQLEVLTWKDLRRNILKAVLIEKFLVYFLVLILVFFTGSMVLLMLLLTVIEKTRDIGVLMSLGATPRGVTSIFFLNGFLICTAGTSLGLGLGFAFCTYINEIHDAFYDATGWSLFNAEIYHMDRIPIAFEPLDILLSTLPPVVIGLLASLVPALWAPRRDPIKAIQYE